MKALITVLIISICMVSFVYAQDSALDSCKQNFLYSRAQSKAYQDSLKIYKNANKKLLEATTVLQLQHEQDTTALGKANLQIADFKLKETQTGNAFRWDGFWAGMSAVYPFNDSSITRQTFLGGLRFDITAKARVIVLDRISLEGGIGIPMRKEKFYIRAEAGWRLF